jgi:hypothetical protein
VSTLAELGLRTVVAGADIAFDDTEGQHRHSAPDEQVGSWGFAALCARGWAVNRATFERLRTHIATAPGGFCTPPWGALFSVPTFIDDDVPDGMLRPIYLERITRA